MEMKLLVLFIIMNIVNVVIQTIKSIATIKYGKTAAALINALAYGLYTYIIILTNCDLPLLAKCLIVASTNFASVWVVKYFEEKARKDKLWRIQAVVPIEVAEKVKRDLKANRLLHNYINIEKYYLFNVYCENQEQNEAATVVLDYYNAKYFISESETP